MAAEVLTTREVADYLRTSEDNIKRLARQGRLPAVKIGRAWRFRRRDIDMLFEDALVDQGLMEIVRERMETEDESQAMTLDEFCKRLARRYHAGPA